MKSVFISYGGPDEEFAELLERELVRFGTQTFIFSRHAEAGKKLHRVMRDAVNDYDKVILVCSRNSLNRPGVQNEIEEALQREAREGGSSILIPVSIDDYVLNEWAPDYPGLAQAIRDRVVVNFKEAMTDDQVLRDRVFKLLHALADKDERPPKFENTGGCYRVEILDPGGHKALLCYQRSFIPRVDDLDRLVITDITSSGKITFDSTNLGRFAETEAEGGRKTLWTQLDAPLRKNEEVEHIVQMTAIDCYLESPASATFHVSAYYPEISLITRLPTDRPAKTVKAWRRHDWHKIECPGLECSENNCELKVTVIEPKLNALYILEWDW